MKNPITLLIVLLFTSFTIASAQVNISCNKREICKWNELEESFNICYDYAENSLFKINDSETMFIHTTEDIQSAYYIQSKTRDEETGVWTLEVESDVGNEYIYFLDFPNDEIRVAAEIDEEIIMIRFYVKKVWMN